VEKYRIYEVTSIKIKPNKGGDAAESRLAPSL
jgi:hypothetical protein